MINIDIDINKRSVILNEFKKNECITNDFGNISVNGAEGMLSSIKLMIFAVTKVFVYHKDYFEKEFVFNINDENLITLIKNENNDICEKIKSEWHNDFDNKTISELGRLLSMLKKFPYKDILLMEQTETLSPREISLMDKRAKFAQEQSYCDKKLQDILHDIEYGHYKDPEKVVRKIKDVRLQRRKIKEQIKSIDTKLSNITKEKSPL